MNYKKQIIRIEFKIAEQSSVSDQNDENRKLLINNENISLEDMNNILDTLDNSYKDKKGKWLGSLVTGEGEGKFKDVKPEINLKEIEEEDYLTFNQKVTCFPKDIVDIQMFPQ